jgi:hypothetical protein
LLSSTSARAASWSGDDKLVSVKIKATGRPVGGNTVQIHSLLKMAFPLFRLITNFIATSQTITMLGKYVYFSLPPPPPQNRE